MGVHTMLEWAGYVCSMPDHRLLKKLLYGELKEMKRSHGGQKIRFEDALKDSMENCMSHGKRLDKIGLFEAPWSTVE